MDIKDIKKLKVGDNIEWYETMDGRRTGYRMGYTITRINYKRGLVFGKVTYTNRCWDSNATQLNLSQIELSGVPK